MTPDENRIAEITRQLDELAAAYKRECAPLRKERHQLQSKLRMRKMRAK